MPETETGAAKGGLIALDAASGKELAAWWAGLLHSAKRKSRPGVSRWDASGIFYELRRIDPHFTGVSARTLVLLYAADLTFRLRWEIGPALEAGHAVIAAPYVETAIAFGEAAGMSRRWLQRLFQFMPKPDAWHRVKEKRKGHIGKPSEGFIEFCCAALGRNSPGLNPAMLRVASIDCLNALEERSDSRKAVERVLENGTKEKNKTKGKRAK